MKRPAAAMSPSPAVDDGAARMHDRCDEVDGLTLQWLVDH